VTEANRLAVLMNDLQPTIGIQTADTQTNGIGANIDGRRKCTEFALLFSRRRPDPL